MLGSATHAVRALELDAGGDPSVGSKNIELATEAAPHAPVSVLRRYPVAPSGGGRTGELLRELDNLLRNLSLT